MAVTAGHAWNDNTVADATWTNALPTAHAGVLDVVMECASDSAAPLRVCIVNQKGTDPATSANRSTIHRLSAAATPLDYLTLALGQSIQFTASPENPIAFIYVAGDGGTATFSGTVSRISA